MKKIKRLFKQAAIFAEATLMCAAVYFFAVLLLVKIFNAEHWSLLIAFAPALLAFGRVIVRCDQ